MIRTLTFVVGNVLKQSITYRANVFYMLIHSLFFLFVQVAIWVALYAGKAEVAGTTIEEMITYIILAQMVGIFSGIYFSNYLENRVKSGDVALDLLKPIDMRLLMVFRNIGNAVYQFALRGIPMIVIALIFYRIVPPASPRHLAYFFASVVGAFLISAMIEFSKSTAAFWNLRPNSFGWILGGLESAFGGGFVPLWFFPPALMLIARALPFHLVSYLPAAIYLGKIPSAELPMMLLRQASWIMGLGIVQWLLWQRGMRRITVYGG